MVFCHFPNGLFSFFEGQRVGEDMRIIMIIIITVITKTNASVDNLAGCRMDGSHVSQKYLPKEPSPKLRLMVLAALHTFSSGVLLVYIS